jgi:hypothetical protein
LRHCFIPEYVERHVAFSVRRVAAQQQLVDNLERDGHDTFEAHRLLAQFLDLLELPIADRDRLRAELSGQGSERPTRRALRIGGRHERP